MTVLPQINDRPAPSGQPSARRLRIEARRRRGAAIRTQRIRLKLTQVKLALAVGCLSSQISKVEHGRAGVGAPLVARMEAMLDTIEASRA